MAAELQYRAMDVGYAVSYPHFTQKSEEEGPRVLGVVLGMRAVAPTWLFVSQKKRSGSDCMTINEIYVFLHMNTFRMFQDSCEC